MVNIVKITRNHDLIQIASELSRDNWETLEHSATPNDLTFFLESDLNQLILAYDGDQVVSMLTAHELRKIDHRKCEFMLYEIEVKPQYRGQGIGKMMVQKLVEIAKQKGAYEVWVLTEDDNLPANHLYSSISQKHEKSIQLMYSYNLLSDRF